MNNKNKVIFIPYDEEKPSIEYGVYFNKHKLGELYKEIDGYYVFCPFLRNRCSFFSSWALKAIADKLDELNKKWDQTIQEDHNILNLSPQKPKFPENIIVKEGSTHIRKKL